MEQAETIRTRLKLIDALVAPLLAGTPLHDNWIQLKKELQKHSRQRNRIVHGRWGYSDKLPDSLVKMDLPNYQVWTVEDFRNVLHGINKLTGQIQKLTHDIGKAKAVGQLPVTPYTGTSASSNLGAHRQAQEDEHMYVGSSLIEDEKTATAALVLAVNTLRQLQATGVISPEYVAMSFENAAAVTEPEVGSNLEEILWKNMVPESRERQDQRRGIVREPGKTWD
jgi:hypothetical protein